MRTPLTNREGDDLPLVELSPAFRCAKVGTPAQHDQQFLVREVVVVGERRLAW
jgi:hypothetical protein